MSLGRNVDRTEAHGPSTGSHESHAVRERLEGILEKLVAPKRIRHALLAVETGDQSFRWVGAAGDAFPDGTPMRPDTPIWIASVTKLYIAAAIHKLHEAELVSLGDPMSAYLPQSLIGGLHRLGGVDHTERITLRHLLGHLSGLPDYLEDQPKGEPSLIEQLLEQDASFTIQDVVDIVREKLVPLFSPQPLGAKRKKVRYSDTNYQLLMAIIEAVTGRPTHEVFREMFYEPLGLRHTFHPGTLGGTEPRPATTWIGDRPLDSPQAVRSARDLISTADDMLVFLRALVRGGIFRQQATLEHMMGNWNTFGFNLNPSLPGWPIEYGQGMMRMYVPRILSPFRSLPGMVGHTGFCASWLFFFPEADVLTAGTVDQATAAAVPFRLVPQLPRALGA